MNTKESEILLLFAKAPWKKYTFSEIKTISKKKSKSYLDLTLKRFVKNNIITRETLGRTPIYSLNLNHTKARLFAGFVLEDNAWKKRQIPYKDIEKILNKTSLKNPVLLITGSYVNNTQTTKSDLDTVIIVEDTVDVKKIYAELTNICEMNIPPIHLYIFRNKEFLEMLLNNQPNYGKEIVQNQLILIGGQIYLKLLEEAIRHGFTGKNTY